MYANHVFLLDLTSGIPMLIVQVLLARAAMRRWPQLRWPVLFLLAIPFVITALALPSIQVRYRPPERLELFTYYWMFVSTPAYVVYKVTEWLLRAVFRRRGLENPAAAPTDMRRRDLIRTAALATAAVPVAVLTYGTFIERLNFGVTDTTIPIRNLPEGLDGLRILQISDVHRGAYLSHKDLVRVVDAASELKFDMVMQTGDFITTMGDPLETCLTELSRLRGPGGQYGCLGNHELYADCLELATSLAAQRDIRILRAEAQIVKWNGAAFNLVGVDYQRLQHRHEYLALARPLVVPGMVNVLLSHNPDVFPVAAAMGFDLTIAGHTHGGQVRVEILHQDIDPGRMYTPYVSGYYEIDGRSIYVTRGIGSIRIPTRLGAPPEITLLRLARA